MGGPVKQRDPVDWSIIFDSIASEYGYTWDQFIAMTYKLLNACLESIARRSHNKTAVLAAMHGIKMDLYKEHEGKPLSKDDIKRAKTEVEKILKEKQNG